MMADVVVGFDLKIILKKLLAGLKALLGEQFISAFLYGSRARGNHRPDSDIDVLVVLRDPFNYFEMVLKTSELCSNLSLEYDTVVSLAFTTQLQYDEKQNPFLMNVNNEGIQL